VEGTRELVVSGTPYIVVYRVMGKVITVLRVLHGARQWPQQF
jgi:toxin ParE1/3/4